MAMSDLAQALLIKYISSCQPFCQFDERFTTSMCKGVVKLVLDDGVHRVLRPKSRKLESTDMNRSGDRSN
jgi:hypothetical protein